MTFTATNLYLIFAAIGATNLVVFIVWRFAKRRIMRKAVRSFLGDIRQLEGRRFIFSVSGRGKSCVVVAVNHYTCWVRLADGNQIKRHLLKHGSMKLALELRRIANKTPKGLEGLYNSTAQWRGQS